MPRKTKETVVTDEVEKKPVSSRKKVVKEVDTKPSKGATTKKATSKTKKEETKKSKTTKVAKTNKASMAKKTTKDPKTTKASNLKETAKSTTVRKTKKVAKAEFVSVMEYYDLPYRYNQTVVRILAQTPQMLFVYWDISDVDRDAFTNHYGKDFFSKTKPVLIVHNETMNYSFEIEINDFANCWYLHVNDANCKYIIELGRRPFTYFSNISEPYIYISSSNEMDAPNNHILFEKFHPDVTYKNTKTGSTCIKDFSTLANYKNMQKIYNIYDLYKKIYQDELSDGLANPSSIFK